MPRTATHVFSNYRRNEIVIPAGLDDKGNPVEGQPSYRIPEAKKRPGLQPMLPGVLRITDPSEAERIIARLGEWIDNDLLKHHTE